MARVKPDVAPPRRTRQYRVCFLEANAKPDSTPLVSIPGVIKNNRPRADRVLASYKNKREAWIETRWGYDGEWKKVED